MHTRIIAFCLLTAAMLPAAAVAAPAGPARGTLQERVDQAIKLGVNFLLSQISEEGTIQGNRRNVDEKDQLYGGLTALVAYALLEAKVSPQQPQLKRAIDWLMSAKLKGTYAVSLRACALAQLNDPKALALLKRDTEWLIEAAGEDGAYGYVSRHGRATGTTDNSNSQFAVLGLWAAAQRGVKVPNNLWRRIERHWLDCQNPDGGWNYRKDSSSESYGSMTAAGMASLFIAFDAIHREDFLQPTGQKEYLPITSGLKWLEENFSIRDNPGRGKQWWYYWLYSVERVARTSGHKRFGKHDWYAEGAARLLAIQDTDGSWDKHQGIHETAFAVLFLVRGRYPVLANKLRYRGRWNARPRDMAGLTHWLSWNFERPVIWQVVDVDAAVTDWQDAPILYISGAGPCEFSDEQIRKLRTFVLRGGLILSEAAGNNGDFTLDMQRTYRRMLPGMSLERLGKDHPVYTCYFKLARPTGLTAISNGIRPLVIHSARELSLAPHLGYRKDNKNTFQLLANIYVLATDKGILLPRGVSSWPEARQYAPAATIRLARLKYSGNWDPEPEAWSRLAIRLANRYRLKLQVTNALEIKHLDAELYPLAVMTGTDSFSLSDDQLEALKGYFDRGGRLVVDAAGGARAFAESVRRQILPLPADAVESPIPSGHAIFTWPERLDKAAYRRDFSLALGSGRYDFRLRGVYSGKRLVIIYSPDDLTAGLLGYQLSALRGYTPKCAADLMTNIVFYAARRTGRPGATVDAAPAGARE